MTEDTNTEETAPTTHTEPQGRTVVYCGETQYCEFGGTVKRCEEWLEKNYPELHARLYSDEALNANLSTLSVSAQKRAEKDASKKAAKAEAQAAAEETRRATAKVQIKRVERNKRKFVTAVSGLEAHGVELKKVAKELGKRFATGSSVTKLPTGLGEEIVVQGDLADDIEEWLLENYEQIPEGNVEVVEDRKRKG
ncbi:MAG: Translation machinery-associated protein 22 [Peltula sp. TS41687]|nr:MAG: Translation machinery-associated protein 22 [Peltula sp. TS41687]